MPVNWIDSVIGKPELLVNTPDAKPKGNAPQVRMPLVALMEAVSTVGNTSVVAAVVIAGVPVLTYRIVIGTPSMRLTHQFVPLETKRIV